MWQGRWLLWCKNKKGDKEISEEKEYNGEWKNNKKTFKKIKDIYLMNYFE